MNEITISDSSTIKKILDTAHRIAMYLAENGEYGAFTEMKNVVNQNLTPLGDDIIESKMKKAKNALNIRTTEGMCSHDILTYITCKVVLFSYVRHLTEDVKIEA